MRARGEGEDEEVIQLKVERQSFASLVSFFAHSLSSLMIFCSIALGEAYEREIPLLATLFLLQRIFHPASSYHSFDPC